MIGRAKNHCKIYRRELEYYKLLAEGKIDGRVENDRNADKTMTLTGHANRYKNVYRLHNLEVKEFFNSHAPNALHVGQLEDPRKWQKLGDFLGVEVPSGYSVHANQSERKSAV